jgi:hypothetical protein
VARSDAAPMPTHKIHIDAGEANTTLLRAMVRRTDDAEYSTCIPVLDIPADRSSDPRGSSFSQFHMNKGGVYAHFGQWILDQAIFLRRYTSVLLLTITR